MSQTNRISLNYLLLLSDDSISAESLLRLLELPEDSLPWDSFPWESLPWDSLPWDSVPLPLDPLLFISTSSWRECFIFRLLWDEAGGSWLLSLPSDARPSSAPFAKLPMQCNVAIELQPAASFCPSREENRYGLESESSDIRLGLKKWSKCVWRSEGIQTSTRFAMGIKKTKHESLKLNAFFIWKHQEI